jgi:hypothetical protein
MGVLEKLLLTSSFAFECRNCLTCSQPLLSDNQLTESAFAATTVEQSAQLLQGAQGAGRGSSEQPEGVADSVLEAKEIGERGQPGHPLHADDCVRCPRGHHPWQHLRPRRRPLLGHRRTLHLLSP